MLNYETDSNEQYTINIPKCFFFIILRKMIDLKLRIFGQILHRAKSIPDKIKIKIKCYPPLRNYSSSKTDLSSN